MGVVRRREHVRIRTRSSTSLTSSRPSTKSSSCKRAIFGTTSSRIRLGRVQDTNVDSSPSTTRPRRPTATRSRCRTGVLPARADFHEEAGGDHDQLHDVQDGHRQVRGDDVQDHEHVVHRGGQEDRGEELRDVQERVRQTLRPGGLEHGQRLPGGEHGLRDLQLGDGEIRRRMGPPPRRTGCG